MTFSYLILLTISAYSMCFAYSDRANYKFDYGEFDYPDINEELPLKKDTPSNSNFDKMFAFQRNRNNFGPSHRAKPSNSYGNNKKHNTFQNPRASSRKNFHDRMSNPFYPKQSYGPQFPKHDQAKMKKSFLPGKRHTLTENYTSINTTLPPTGTPTTVSVAAETSATTMNSATTVNPATTVNSATTVNFATTKGPKRAAGNLKMVKRQRAVDVKNIDFKQADSLGKWFDKEMSDVEPEIYDKTKKPKTVESREAKRLGKRRHHLFNKMYYRRSKNQNPMTKLEKIRHNRHIKRHSQNPDPNAILSLIPRGSNNEENFNHESYKSNDDKNYLIGKNSPEDYPELMPNAGDGPNEDYQLPNSPNDDYQVPNLPNEGYQVQNSKDFSDDRNTFGHSYQHFRPAIREAPAADSLPKNTVVTVTAPLQEKPAKEESDLMDKTNDIPSRGILRSPNVEQKMRRVKENVKSKKTLINDKRLQQETSVIENEKERVNDDVEVKSVDAINKTEASNESTTTEAALEQNTDRRDTLNQGMHNKHPFLQNQRQDNKSYLQSDRKMLKKNFLSPDQDMANQNFLPQNQYMPIQNFFPQNKDADNQDYVQSGEEMSYPDYDTPAENILQNKMSSNRWPMGDKFQPGDSPPGKKISEPKTDPGSEPIIFKHGEMVVITDSSPDVGLQTSDKEEQTATAGDNISTSVNDETTTELSNSSMPDIFLKEEKVEKESRTMLRRKEAVSNKTSTIKGERKSQIKDNKERFHEKFVREKIEDKYPIRVEDVEKNEKLKSGKRSNYPKTHIANIKVRGQNPNIPSDGVSRQGTRNNPPSFDYDSDYEGLENTKGEGYGETVPESKDYTDDDIQRDQNYRDVNSADRFIDSAASRSDARFQREPIKEDLQSSDANSTQVSDQGNISIRGATEPENQQAAGAGNVVYFPPTTTTSEYHGFLRTREARNFPILRRHLKRGRH